MIKGYSYTLNYAVKPPDYREDFFMRNSQTKKLVEISILVALAFVLDYLANLFMGWFWPNGGSISISLVPLAIIAFRYGWIAGFTGGFVMGLLQLLTGAYIIHPVQLLFDYPLPSMAMGLAGFFRNRKYLGVFVAFFSKFLCHFISGVVFFGQYAPANMGSVLYSIVVNLPLVAGEMVICMVILKLLPLERIIKIINPNY